jgi:hypothetical protein
MKKKLLSLILTTATILTSYTVDTMPQPQSRSVSQIQSQSVTLLVISMTNMDISALSLAIQQSSSTRQMDIRIQKSVRNFHILKI